MATAANACRWFAVHTHPQHEIIAAHHLRRQSYRVVFLHYLAEIRHARRITRVIRPYFARYLFAGLRQDQPLGPICRTIGVASLIKSGQEPLEVPAPVIDELTARASPDGLVAPAPARLRPLLAPGEDVMIAHGPLSGFRATVILDDKTKVRLLVKWLGRQIEATVDPEAVTALSPALRSAP
jgi:transcription antitermination factor NusG